MRRDAQRKNLVFLCVLGGFAVKFSSLQESHRLARQWLPDPGQAYPLKDEMARPATAKMMQPNTKSSRIKGTSTTIRALPDVSP